MCFVWATVNSVWDSIGLVDKPEVRFIEWCISQYPSPCPSSSKSLPTKINPLEEYKCSNKYKVKPFAGTLCCPFPSKLYRLLAWSRGWRFRMRVAWKNTSQLTQASNSVLCFKSKFYAASVYLWKYLFYRQIFFKVRFDSVYSKTLCSPTAVWTHT